MKKIIKNTFIGALALTLISTPSFAVEFETRSLDELYEAAIEEGGKLVIWSGGDKPGQRDQILIAFRERFPKIDLQDHMDLSKYHNGRFDLAVETGRPVPDVIELQTLHDFDFWKEKRLLVQYRPLGWDKVYPAYKDPDGYWMGLYGVSFSNVFNKSMIPEDEAPRDAMDYLNPALKGKIILTYPHDDDAVLYQFWHLQKKYGWEYIEKLIANEPLWVRGTAMPYVAVDNGWYPVSFTTSWAFVPYPNSDTRFILPKDDFFLTWTQSAAIPKGAAHPESARLYLSFVISKEFQSVWYQWPVRTDVTARGGYGSIHDHHTSPVDFHNFMRDRGKVERFKIQIEELIGPATGISPMVMNYTVKPK